jgi:hypothetical protein
MGPRTAYLTVTAIATACALAAPTWGQDDAPPSPRFSVSAAGQLGFDSDLDGGGEIGISRVGTRIDAEIDLSDQVTLGLRTTYELSLYDFSGGVSDLGAADPWDDVHFLTLQGNLQWKLDQHWIVYGGPVLRFARESGASWEDGFTGGGFAGATYIVNERLIVGGGFGVQSDIEDDARVYPIIVLSWTFSDQWRLQSTSGLPNIAGAGLELVWQPLDDWTFSVGGHYEFRRFRLDDDGAAPMGVGEETVVPIWVKASYKVDDNVSLDLYAGMLTFRQFDFEDNDGNTIGEADADPAPTIALVARFAF